MKTQSTSRRWISLAIIAMIFFSPAILQGCDGLMSSNEPIIDLTAPTSKMRHAHLFGSKDGTAGKVLDRYSELATSTEFILGFSDTVLDAQRILDRYSLESGVKVKRLLLKSVNGFSMHIDADQLDRLLAIIELDNDIAWMEPDPEFNFALTGKTWSMENGQKIVSNVLNIKGDKSSTVPGDGKGAVDMDIYILDTGVDHPDLNIVERVDFTTAGQEIDMTKILDRFSETLDSFSDGVGHGTHVAGIAAAIDDTDDLVGMAPGARIHDFKVLNDLGKGEMSSVIAALDVIMARKQLDPNTPVVVNLSLGAYVGTTAYNALDEAVDQAVNSGVVVVVAAGNDGADAAMYTPAHVTSAITVGASYLVRNNNFEVAPYSNMGDVVDIYAVGDKARSLAAFDHTLRVEMNGTSMAAPLVTGAVALYLEKHPKTTPNQIKNLLRTLSEDFVHGKGKSAITLKHLDGSRF